MPPREDDVISAATRLLSGDRDLDAVVDAHDTDRDPLVRKVAGWYCPGGPIYQRLRPRMERGGVSGRGRLLPTPPSDGP
jgi:hypothetical protein